MFQYKTYVLQVLDILNVYMQQKETILMVVIPCTMEIATTKALRLALDADKDGSRTLGEEISSPWISKDVSTTKWQIVLSYSRGGGEAIYNINPESANHVSEHFFLAFLSSPLTRKNEGNMSTMCARFAYFLFKLCIGLFK